MSLLLWWIHHDVLVFQIYDVRTSDVRTEKGVRHQERQRRTSPERLRMVAITLQHGRSSVAAVHDDATREGYA